MMKIILAVDFYSKKNILMCNYPAKYQIKMLTLTLPLPQRPHLPNEDNKSDAN